MKPMCHPGTRQKNSCHLYCSLQLKIYMLSLLISTINPCIYFVNHCARVQDIPQIKAFTVYFCRHSVLVFAAAAAAAKLLQSCPTLCDPIDGSSPGSPIPRILWARTLEWVAISFFNAWKWKVKVKSLSRVRLFATAWTAAYQAPPSMGFSRQEYWSISFYCCIKSYLKISSLKQ